MIAKFLHECKRVLQVARKPDKDEYLNVAKITGIGVLIIGTIGFIISMASFFLGGASG
ncbi:MAG: protein translocase SEC61 complex subunit gamma [Hadesarchaea archaeon]|nr:protein translocase SEC61 complex subunit gamma [Hadesarchaea archaeon]